jgi:fructose-bisphosphate aldolase class II
LIVNCLRNGWTSIMIDGSHAPLKENIAITKEIVKMAHPVGVSIEAELGRLGGIEDNISVDERDARLTDPDEAEQFVQQTDCDTLAIAIGTSHGAYKFKGEAKLAFDRLEEIGKRIDIPLVLHGASSVIPEIIAKANKYGANLGAAKGVPVEDIKKAISLGITKVNIDTDLRLAFTAGVREILSQKPELFDPRKIIGAGREAIKQVVKTKIELLGSTGKA